jgi:hypothetical protein
LVRGVKVPMLADRRIGLRRGQRYVRAAIVAAGLFTTSCASHLIRSAESEPVGNAGQPYRHSSTSILAPTGLSSDGPGYVTRDTCRSGDLAQVELRRNFGQTLVTLLTLGIVSPATFYYLCEKPAVPPPPPPCNCTEGPEL